MGLGDPLRRWYHHAVLAPWRDRFAFFERHGLHIVRATYDSPVPDTRLLADGRWRERSAMVGVDLRSEAQLTVLRELSSAWRAEYSTFPLLPSDAVRVPHLLNGGFGPVDAELLYAVVRQYRPRRVIEVGAGYSTRFIAAALERNAGDGVVAESLTIDPAGGDTARQVAGVTRHIAERVESLPLSTFAELSAGDILFIDSPHVVTTGGAVLYLMLEVVPRVAPGVLIHVHDVFLPDAYPATWVTQQLRFYTEQYLLQAFLAFNGSYEVLLMANYLHTTHPDALTSAIPSYDRTRDAPGSFWMRRTR
jgi:predicted O-methyltransferase YrrM